MIAQRNGSPEIDRLPPHDIASEQGVLACILREPERCLPECLARLEDTAFYDLRHQVIFEELRGMHKSRVPVDILSIQHRLKTKQQLESVGGLSYLATLPDATPSAVNLSHYVSIVQDLFAQRKAIQAATETISGILENPEHAATIIKAGRDALDHIYQGCSNTLSSLPQIVDAATFVATDRPSPREMVAGVLHKGSKLVLGGGSKSFKTWLLLDLALSVSHSANWLNFPTAKGRVLYVNLEIQEKFFAERLQVVSQAKGITIDTGRLLLMNLRGKSAGYSTLLPQIENQARAEQLDLILLDPIYKLYGNTDENSAGDVSKLLNEIERLAVNSEAAVAFGAHFSKGNQSGKESIDRISGSGVFARDPDSILIFTRHEEEDAFTVEPTLRNLPPIEPFAVRWNFPLMRADDSLDPSRLKQVGANGPRYWVDQLFQTLSDQKLTTGEWCKQAQNDFGMSRRTFYDLHKEAQRRQNVTQNKQRQWFLKD